MLHARRPIPHSRTRRLLEQSRRAALIAFTLAFATFVSVANATAEETPQDPQQPTGDIVILVPASDPQPPAQPEPQQQEETPADPTPESTPEPESTPDPTPEPKPAPTPESKPAPEPEPTPEAQQEPQQLQSLQAPTPPAPKKAEAPQERVAAAQPNPNACRGNASYCRVVPDGSGGYTVADTVTICHATSGVASTGYGFNVQGVNADSIIAGTGTGPQDHGGHSTPNFWTTSYSVGDIIPAFQYGNDANHDGVISASEVSSYAGKNLGTTAGPSGATWQDIYGSAQTGQSIFDAGCTATTPPQQCDAGELGTPPNCLPEPPVANKVVTVCHANGGGSFTKASWTIVDGDVTAGHGADAGDIIPGFTYTTGFAPNTANTAWVEQTASFTARNLATTYPYSFTVFGQTVNISVTGQWLYDNDCNAPVGPPAVTETVRLCHQVDNGWSLRARVPVDRIVDPATGNVVRHGRNNASHGYDVIPSFDYTTGFHWDTSANGGLGGWVADTDTYPGKNLGDFTRTLTLPVVGTVDRALNGTDLLAADCAVTVAPEPPVQHVAVSMCHQTQGIGNDGWTYITTDDDGVLGNGAGGSGHDSHDFDVIPAFQYVTGHTYDPSTNTWSPTYGNYPGKNLGDFTRTIRLPGNVTLERTFNGAQMLKDGCEYAPIPPEPSDSLTISICHQVANGWVLRLRVDYTRIVNPATGSPVRHGRDNARHGYDVIPAFDYPTGYTYDGSTNTWTPNPTGSYGGKNLGDFSRVITFPDTGAIPWQFNGQDLLDSGCEFGGPSPKPPVTATPVSLCHAQAIGGYDTWVAVDTDSDGVLGQPGHDQDVNDVIPAFDYVTGYVYDVTTDTWDPVTVSYPGKNTGTFTRTMDLPVVGMVDRTFTGSDLLANGCAYSAVPPQPPVQATPVTMCHAATVNGIDTYLPVVTDTAGVLAPGGHDADAWDVIPAFDYVTMYVYDGATNTWNAQTASYAGKNLGDFSRTVTLSSGSTTVTLNGTTMLASGACDMPALPDEPDSIVPDQSDTVTAGSGDQPVEDEPTIVAAGTDEPDQAVVEAADEDALPFTGQQLSLIVLLGIGALLGGSLVHARQRRRGSEQAGRQRG